MVKRSRRYRSAAEKQQRDSALPTDKAVDLLLQFDKAGFDETIDLVMNLGIDPRQSTQNVRGSFSLPNGIGKSVRVIAFAEGEDAEKAKAAGAIEVGTEDLTKKIQGGWLDFDVAVAHPRMMRFVGRLGKVLGPQGKMPSPKSGTVTEDVEQAVKEFCAGKIEFRNDKSGNLHVPVGKRSFDRTKLVENIQAFIQHIQGLRPSGVKGNFIRSIFVSSTMSPSVKVAL